ncbi:50S ribosomal protein L9 [Salinispira pacifica]|uniref:50S ribosomal protein L9 n=1 Tax=Salinispira pacifica TaxID=1307761 RepID=UPI00059E6619|nr:50S ribosomal protein L9 [Salinispira pacifica]
MKVILNTDIANLGEEGDIINVSPGYARNFLLPKGMVSMYNKANLAVLESRMKAIEKRKEEKRKNALSLKERINGTTLTFNMPAGDNGKLFGAVTSQMIVDELARQEMEVERKKVEIPGHTLKSLGNYKLKIKLYGDQEAELGVDIQKEGGKADATTAPAAKAEKPAAAPAAEAEQSAPAESREPAAEPEDSAGDSEE